MIKIGCVCGSKKAYAMCCAPVLAGNRAETAEILMRSRYTAFVEKNEAYLLATWHPDTRPESLDMAYNNTWLGLTVLTTQQGQPDDDK